MGFSFRKSTSIGPLRINFSKKGIGASVGIPGIRIGKQAGRSGLYLRGGKNGVNFRKKI